MQRIINDIPVPLGEEPALTELTDICGKNTRDKIQNGHQTVIGLRKITVFVIMKLIIIVIILMKMIFMVDIISMVYEIRNVDYNKISTTIVIFLLSQFLLVLL